MTRISSDDLPRMPAENCEPPKSTPKISKSPREVLWERRGFPLRHVRHALGQLGENPAWECEFAKLLEKQGNPDGSLVALFGARGTGKTQMAVSAAMRIDVADMAEETRPMYRKASEIFRELRSCFRNGSEEITEARMFYSYLKPVLLIIDEAHERGDTDFEDRNLVQIIDGRYDRMLHTVLITNQTREETKKSLGSSIVSRMVETGSGIECTWSSWRKQAVNL